MSVVKDVDLEAMPSSIFVNDDDNDDDDDKGFSPGLFDMALKKPRFLGSFKT